MKTAARSSAGMLLKTARTITGGLSRTSKMPCHSWGIPASSCITGSRLAKDIGAVCNQCYALKHAYAWKSTQAAYQRRLEAANNDEWLEAMTTLIHWQAQKNKTPYFRFFDSGDLQSATMLERIIEVAIKTPAIAHWLPTREYGFVREVLGRKRPPPNLVIRLSATKIDASAPSLYDLPTSTVSTREHEGLSCPAYSTKPARCGDCRACWKHEIKNVDYPLHK